MREAGDAIEQMQHQKKLVADCTQLAGSVRKTADTDVADVPTPRSSGKGRALWEGNSAPAVTGQPSSCL